MREARRRKVRRRGCDSLTAIAALAALRNLRGLAVWFGVRESFGFRGSGLNQKALGHFGLAQRLQWLHRCCNFPPDRKARRWYASVWKTRLAARLLSRRIDPEA